MSQFFQSSKSEGNHFGFRLRDEDRKYSVLRITIPRLWQYVLWSFQEGCTKLD